MKHYSEIIKKLIDENSKNQEPEIKNPKNEEKMNSITYSHNKSDSFNIDATMLRSSSLANKIKQEIRIVQSRFSYFFIALFKVTSRIIRFVAFLIQIIYTSILEN